MLPVAGDDNTHAGDKRVNTVREKVLQTATLLALRSMRAVLCGIYLGRSSSLSRSPYRPGVPKAALNVVVAKGRDPDSPDEDSTRCYEPSKRLLGAFRSALV
jgi:hypothetical protein